MTNFDDLKRLWQKQTSPQIDKINIEEQLPGLIEKLKKFEKKQFGINLFKTVMVTIIVVSMFFFIKKFDTGLFTNIGAIINILAIVWFLFVYWKKQFRVSELNLNNKTNSFLENAIVKLKEQKKLFNIYFPIFGLSLLIGLNIMYLELLASETLDTKLIMHIGISGFLVIIFYLGRKVRIIRIKKEWQPLIDELTTIKNDLIERG